MPSNEIMVHPKVHSSMNEATILKTKQNKTKENKNKTELWSEILNSKSLVI